MQHHLFPGSGRARHRLAELVRLGARLRASPFPGEPPGAEEGLVETPDFGPNPGNLRMLSLLPEGVSRGAPLVVVLHGCRQRAGGHARGSGWTELARRRGLALLLPEQREANNPNRCFRWFERAHAARGAGEAVSIRAMVSRLVSEHGLDASRVHVTGLSAGGAMAAAMLAAYPEVFAGGAVVAGLPYGGAWGVGEALRAMSAPDRLSGEARASTVRAASGRDGPWPSLSIWHGLADRTVSPANAEETLKGWLRLRGLEGRAPWLEERVGPRHRRLWRDAAGRGAVEINLVAGMDHGVPLAPGEGEGRCGEAGPWLLDAGVSSTHAILGFWGLAPEPATTAPATTAPAAAGRSAPAGVIAVGPDGVGRVPPERPRPVAPPAGVGAVIERALRAAGLRG